MRFFTLLLCFPLLLSAQEWQLVTPVKHDSDLLSVQAVGNQTFFMLEGNAFTNILKSTDGGQTWRRLDHLFGVDQGYDLYMLDDLNGFLALDNEILRTTDGAENFTQVARFSTFINAFYFINQDIGYAVGRSGLIVKTVDGGETWTEQTSNINLELLSAFFVDANVGFVCGVGGALLRTVDGGDTWMESGNGDNALFRTIYFFDALNGVVAGNFSTLLYTRDGGLSWEESQHGTNVILYEFHPIGQDLFVVGQQGSVLRSSDQGASWSVQNVGDLPFFDLDFDGQEGLMCGEGVVYYSSDGGESWQLRQLGIDRSQLRRVDFANNQIGVAVGDDDPFGRNCVLTTFDGGQHWERTQLTGSNLASVHLRADGMGIVGGDGSRHLLTKDYGQSWEDRGVAGSIAIAQSCWMHNEDSYMVSGGNGISQFSGLYWTEDDGQNWVRQTPPLPTVSLLDIDFLSPELGYGYATGSALFKTEDGGASWENIGDVGPDFRDIQFLTEEIGFVGGRVGITKTLDGGQSWALVPSTWLCDAFHFYDEQRGYMINLGALWYTEDGGNSWTEVIPSYSRTQNISDAAFVNGKIIAIGENSDVFIAEIPRVITAFPAVDVEVCGEIVNGTGTEIFDLTANEERIINDQARAFLTYHFSAEEADKALNPIANPDALEYTGDSVAIFARIGNDTSEYYHTTTFNLVLRQQPEAGAADSIFIVENDGDSLAIFDLTINAEQILGAADTSGFVLTYHESLAAAEAGIDAISNPENYQNIQNPQTVYVRLTNPKGGCYSTNSFVIETDGTTSLQEIEGVLFSIYPNPTKEVLWLRASSIPANTSVQLYNTQGHLLQTHYINATEINYRIDSSPLPPGLYLLHIHTPTSNHAFKIVKQ
ncbi:MAG: YCF48-related protein [Bacteroidota bacterium]